MGLLRWLRGGDDSASAGSLSAGLAELGAFFSPGQRKQTEHVEEQKRLRKDVHAADGKTGIDLDRGVAVIRKPSTNAG
jgi:hypothetical protein